ncbi:PBP1A family penicillin-binding protein [Sphingosinicella sp. LY1275]|uniref:penicillin-binding protein 1A n=1 Tax=Sphingosinicella sp. LY1275 TaxID=3095379 RepID=UPI002ADEDCC7|nr:PBP1A family penicillin-binding protein [Sphingosinicella sp. LY1275]MEA1015450.1 PBP1A family penicillin-binding protein [Sphingosinicella sp. LY1275]
MTAETSSTRFTLYRENAGRFGDALRRLWTKRWFRWLTAAAAVPIVGFVLLWFLFARGLPSADTLLTYQPPLPTNVRGIDGEPVQTFARERRVQLSYDEFPRQLIQAYLAAEDRTFFSHGGIDYPGIVGAVISNLRNSGRPVGASTITQQVAKNLLLTNELSYTRKIKEAFLAKRIESVLTKQQILELYLNQIFLGRNAYGVQSAARAYFDKDVQDLALHEMAYLAILPKAPSNYSPERHTERALGRRNWVLGEMERNGFITAAQRAEAQAQPLGTVRGARNSVRNVGGYFMEEVRRQLVEEYGEDAEDSPNGVYQGGLWVRTSYDHVKQQAAETALRDGMMRYDRGKGWRDPGLSVDMSQDWRRQLAAADYGVGYEDWRPAVVIDKSGGSATIGFADGSTGTLPASAAQMEKRGGGGAAFNHLRPGMVIAVKQEGGSWALRSVPEVGGGMVVEEVATGRILAMQGGWDVRGSSFNRATQAQRQPGSTFKPIVYSAALDAGMTPASIIVDGPFCVWQGAGLGQKCFRNFSGGNAGPQTMRWGLEQSRNLMTVRAANQTGMEKVTKLAKTLGVGDYPNYLSIALGAGDTTVMKMTNAFAIMANNGKALTPTLIDYIQDRNGKVIYRTDKRPCEGCDAPDWDGKPMPRPPLRTKQVMDPMTAYQMVHILEGVVQRGTAQRLRDLGRPLFGKTGTTSGPTDVWFVGGSADIVAGVYMGFDQPRPMGGWAQGGTLAAPIFKQFALTAFKDMPVVPFRAPEGVRMVRIDRRSGRKVFGEWPSADPKAAVIWEAFKPESEPRRTARRYELPDREALAAALKSRRAAASAPRRAEQPQDSDFLQNQGGIY